MTNEQIAHHVRLLFGYAGVAPVDVYDGMLLSMPYAPRGRWIRFNLIFESIEALTERRRREECHWTALRSAHLDIKYACADALLDSPFRERSDCPTSAALTT